MSSDVASRKEEEEKEEEEEKDTLRVVSVIGREADINNGLEWCPKTEEEDQREVRQLLLPKRRERKKDDDGDEVTTSKRNSIWRRLRRIVDVDRSIGIRCF